MVNTKEPIFLIKNGHKGQIWDGLTSKNLKHPVMYLCTKFHAFTIKSTIYHKSAVLPYLAS